MKIDWKSSALILVDVQNDFCQGGALAVNEGSKVVQPLNGLAKEAARNGSPVIATQDWHPANHCSFAENGGTWPPHCVQGTKGADFHPALDLQPITLVLRKGFRTSLDSYSAFFENDRKTPTGLDAFLKCLGSRSVYSV